MTTRSDCFFHFTKSLGALQGILTGGFHPRYSLEDTSWVGFDYAAYPMVCFCDIPISRISDHSAFYGEYGIGMTRDWGLKNSLQPLLYALRDGTLTRLARKIRELGKTDKADEERVAALRRQVRHEYFELIPMIKPVTGKMLIGGSIVEKDFSQESEWRFVPDHEMILYSNDFEELRDRENAKVAKFALQFSPSDVKYIFVKSDHEIPELFDFIQNKLGRFPMNDLKVLISRIVSLETLSRDL